MIRLLLAAGLLMTPPRTNSVYFGEDVSTIGGKHETAIEIHQDGTVWVFMGAVVPGLRDARGNPVRIRKVRTVHETR